MHSIGYGRTVHCIAALASASLGVGASGAVAAPAASISAGTFVRSAANASSPHAFKTLHSFTGGADGAYPSGSLDLAISLSYPRVTSSVYGTTLQGGARNQGVIYSEQLQTGAFDVKYSFTWRNGSYPEGGLANNISDAFLAGSSQIGTTMYGGAYQAGTLYVLGADGTPTTVHSFTGGADGGSPMGRVTPFVDGNFYGTSQGGTFSCGTIYKYSPKTGTFKTIHEFKGGSDGCNPMAGLSVRVVGRPEQSDAHATPERFARVLRAASFERVLYGVTYRATCCFTGPGSEGTLFSIAPNGTFKTLHLFNIDTDGGGPIAELTPDLNGNLYGVAQYGGSGIGGTVFVLKPRNAFAVVHAFKSSSDVSSPATPITIGYNGSIYGTAATVIFQISPSGFSVIHRFDRFASASSKLIDGFDGYLYGTASNGGAAFGSLFKIAK